MAKVLAAGAALSTRDLRVNGNDLMTAFGRKPGPWLKEVLDALLEAVTNEPALIARAALLAMAREIVGGGDAGGG